MRSRLLAVAYATAAALVLPCATPSDARAQEMREALDRLFVFGEGEEALFLAGSAGAPATEVHGNHFIPAEIEANAAILDFFTNAIARSVSSFPIPTTVASETFVFVDGVPTPTSTSFGPISAERAQTVGRGRLNAGISFTHLGFTDLRGVHLDDVRLTFVHENVDFPNCDEIFQGDCSLYGVPQVENDVIDLTLDLDMGADVFVLYGTYGLTDWLDLSVAVPVVNLELNGVSTARITPSTGDEALHFFGGTQENPELAARSQTRGETTGIGDVAVRLKARVAEGDTWQLGVLAETRAPTGREEDFLGTGEWNAKGLLILSGEFQGFSPHANVGYEFRGSDLEEDDFETVLGFDHRVSSWATLAVDLLGTFKVGDRELLLPEPVEIEEPFRREVELTNLPERRDDVIDGALGFKFRTGPGLILITNVLVPLNDGGLRTGPVPTVGLEYSF